MIKEIDFNVTNEKYEELLQNNEKALNRLIKKENKKHDTSVTPYAGLKKPSVLFKSSLNCVVYCELHDQYYEDYYAKYPDVERTEPTLRKPILRSSFHRLKNGTRDVTNIQFKISEYDLQILFSLYPQARSAAEAVRLLFSEIEFIANNSHMDAHNSSAGGKKSALRYFNLNVLSDTVKPLNETDADMIDLSKIKCTTLAEAFARTIAITLGNFYNFKSFYCSDIDRGFVNYMEVIKKWCDEMIESIKVQFKELLDTFNRHFECRKVSANVEMYIKHNKRIKHIKRIMKTNRNKRTRRKNTTKFKVRRRYWTGEKTNEVFKALIAKSRNVTSKSSKKTKIEAAAALYIVINCSFSGNEKNAVSTLMGSFSEKLARRVSDLRYLSCNLSKIQYVHSDFRKTIMKFRDDPTALLILDPPFLKEFGLPCGDYKNVFTYKDMLDMFKLLKGAKCKVILFHSRSYWFDSTAVSYGFRQVGNYVGRNIGKEYKPYTTEVYSLNINVKFFDPKGKGELYTYDSQNTLPHNIISSGKGVLQ